MAEPLITLDIRNRRQWRTWLGKHHASSPGVWLVFHKDHTSVKSIAYEDSVREALCFGWIDSLIKRLDDERYARKFTPRKATSKWSVGLLYRPCARPAASVRGVDSYRQAAGDSRETNP